MHKIFKDPQKKNCQCKLIKGTQQWKNEKQQEEKSKRLRVFIMCHQ